MPKQQVIDGFTCLIGQDAQDNWNILCQSKQNHIFFHLSSFPSCYVILQTEQEVSQQVLHEAALLCKNNTKYRNLKNIYIDYTAVSNVKRGSKLGEVYYKNMRKVNKIKV